ncbi:MAG: ankyrin repeat domain-containing protein [Pirellulaceae bacterium]
MLHFHQSHNSLYLTVGCLFAACCITGCQPPLTVDNAEILNAQELTVAALRCQQSGEATDAGYLFVLSKLRYQIDRQVYTQRGAKPEDPRVALAALGAILNQASMSEVFRDPERMSSILARVRAWSPSFQANYKPGWNFQEQLNQEQAAQVVQNTIESVLPSLETQIMLFRDSDYRQAAMQFSLATRQLEKIAAETPEQIAIQPTQLRELKQRQLAASRRMQEIEWDMLPSKRWHVRNQWQAADFFDDPLVIELCKSIELNDVPEMELMIEAGANVNARGTHAMTPLLWAFPDAKIERFECLLKHGADPNILHESDFGVSEPFQQAPLGLTPDYGQAAKGNSVVHLACRSFDSRFLALVLQYGGDPNLKNSHDLTPLVREFILSPGLEKVQLLIEAGGEVDQHIALSSEGADDTLAMRAARLGRFDILLALLEAGADTSLMAANGEDLRIVVANQSAQSSSNPDYEKVQQWLAK